MHKTAVTFLLAVVAGSASILYAQNTPRTMSRSFNFGVMAGLNVSSFTGKVKMSSFGSGESTLRFSPMLGLTGRYQISNLFAIRTELFFSARGGATKHHIGSTSIGGSGDRTYHSNYRLNYIEIPLLGEFDFMSKKPADRLHVRLAIGASYGLNVASTVRYNDFTLTGNPQVYVEEEYEVADVDGAKKGILNAVAELSFEFVSVRLDTPLFVKMRYTGTLDEVYKEDVVTTIYSEPRMNTYSVIFGFHFLKN